MERTGEFIRGLTLLVIGILLVGAIAWRWMRGSRDAPGWLIAKWIISLLVVAFAVICVVPVIMQGGMGAFAIVYIAACGMVLAVLWTPNVTAFLAQPFGNLIDGGSTAPEPEAL